MRTLDMIASENYSEHTEKDIQVMRIVQDETLDYLKRRLWDAGLDVGKVAEVFATFRREHWRGQQKPQSPSDLSLGKPSTNVRSIAE